MLKGTVEMVQRIMTGFGLLLIVCVFYFFGGYYYLFQFGLSLVGVIGMLELARMIQNDERFNQDKVLTWGACTIVAALPWVNITRLALFVIFGVTIIIFLRFIFNKKNNLPLLAYIFLMLIIFGVSLTLMSYFYLLNKYYIAFFMFVAFGSDTFAYFVGYFFGRHQLIPWVSPKKTIEGAIGGLFGAIVAVLLFQFILMTYFQDQIPPELDIYLQPGKTSVLIILLAAWSQCGDLFFSKMKRYFATKDYGYVLPGHGGVIDRLDGLTFVVLIFSFLHFVL